MRNLTAWTILINLLLSALAFLVAEGLHFPSLIPCTAPASQSVIAACAIALLFDLAVVPKIGPINRSWALTAVGACCAIAVWLGFYAISPLRFGRGGSPIVSGFMIARSERQPVVVSLGSAVAIAADSPVEIEPITLAGTNVSCRWRSANGGAIDDPASCDIVYQPPVSVAYDALSVLAQPSCGLPEGVSQLRFSIAP